MRMTVPVLEIKNLHASIGGKEILKGLSLKIMPGEVHAIMGPNGAGKSTLSNIIMGHPKYEVTKGEILFKGKNVAGLSPDQRAKAGLFLSFQYPFEIQGLPFIRFLNAAYKARFPGRNVNLLEFSRRLTEKAKQLGMKDELVKRELNVGFSGGEKKRAEILQMMMLEPELAILDETDSGLDIDSLKLVAEAVSALRNHPVPGGPDFSALVITHYKRILGYLKPDQVHVLVDGRMVASGDASFADQLEAKGYAWIVEDKPAVAEATQ